MAEDVITTTGIARHGATRLPSVDVDSFNIELKDDDGFLGDRASKGAFRKILDSLRKPLKKNGDDPLGTKPAESIAKSTLDEVLVGDDVGAAALVHGAIEEFAQELAHVTQRFLKTKAWADTERIVVGGGFRESRVGELAIARTDIILKAADFKVDLVPIRFHPDDAGLIGCLHLAPSWIFEAHDSILAVDIGGTNIRCGVVETRWKKAPDLSKAEVWKSELWRHADDEPTREGAVKRLVKMLKALIAEAETEGLKLAPFIGIACPGVIKEHGSIEKGAQNLQPFRMVTPPVVPRPKAFSYIRMSTDAQLKGDSHRRQLETSDRYIADNGLELVERLSDLGVSAFRGANVEYGALGRFLQAVREGKVKPGSYLIVEALDRISRQPTRIALQLFLELMNSGIVVVTLSNDQVYTTENYDTQQLIISIIEMSRAAEESAKKSYRVSQAWQNKRNAIASRKLTRRGPAWLRFVPDLGEFEPIPERAEVIRRIFDETVSGIGAFTIASRLNDDEVPTFGKSQRWQPSSVNKIVSSPAVIGEFQLHMGGSGGRTAYEAPIKGYFPSVISDDLFYAAQASRLGRRKVGGGGKGKYVSNLFAKIVYCSYCGSRMLFEDKGGGPKGGTYFVCMSVPTGSKCVRTRWRYDHFEASFLAFVEELDLGSIFSVEADAAKRAEIEADISSLGGQLQLLKQQRENIFALSEASDMNIEYVSGKLRDCELLIAQTASKIEAARNHLASMSAAAAAYYESRDQIRELIGRVRTKSADNYKTRAQIASRLKSLIDRIDVAVVGQARSNQRIADFLETARDEEGASRELRQDAAEVLDLHRSMIGESENFRYFLVWFKDGTTRIVWPSVDDPLQFEQRMAPSVILSGEKIQAV